MKSPRSFRRSLLGAAALLALAPQAWPAAYSWDIGTLSASGVPASLGASDTLSIGYGNYKYVDTGLSNAGSVSWLDTLYFQNGNTISNSGWWDATADSAFADAGNGGAFINTGIFRKSGGTGATTIGSGVVFTNSGIIDAQTGVINFASNNASFNAGTQFTGAGQVQLTTNASFNGAFSSQNLQLVSGIYTGTGAQLNGTANWFTGRLQGDWQVAAGATLNLQPGNYHYLNASLANLGTMNVQDALYLQNGNTLTNQGVYALQNDSGLADGGNSGAFVNNGVLRKSGGTGSSVVNGITFTNNGQIDVQTGTFNFQGGSLLFNAGTSFTGAGQALVSNSATFAGAFSTAGNLTLTNGIFTGGDGTAGSMAVLNGDATWVTGRLAGVWQLPAGHTLTMAPGNYHYIAGSVTNLGTVVAQDTLYLSNGNTFSNQALYDIQVDAGLADGGNSGAFVNNRVLRKSGGAGSSVVNGIAFTNNGQIDVQTGMFNFQGGGLRFNDGTAFTGTGQALVSANATFVGSYSTAGNLTLANGTFTGGDGTAGSKAVMNGNTTWSTGSLAGTWEVAAGRTLTLTPGNYHYVNGSVTNLGTVAAQDTLYLQNGNTLANAGRWDLQGDVGVADGGNNGHFVNTGLLVKSSGAGVSTVAGVDFVNAAGGVVDVRSGSIALPANFTNQGTLKGSGAYNAGTLHNDGHVAPGALGSAPGQLTLNGNFAQSGSGSFDVGLQDLTTFGNLWVNGAASLGGTIEVDCLGSCSFSAGTELVVLHSTAALTGTFANLVTSGFATGAFSVSYVGNDVILNVTQGTVAAVPEPGSYALLLAGLGVVGFIARRRRA